VSASGGQKPQFWSIFDIWGTPVPTPFPKSSTSFGWGKGWNVASAGWQVTLCDPIWHMRSSSGVATSVSELLYPCYLLTVAWHPQFNAFLTNILTLTLQYQADTFWQSNLTSTSLSHSHVSHVALEAMLSYLSTILRIGNQRTDCIAITPHASTPSMHAICIFFASSR